MIVQCCVCRRIRTVDGYWVSMRVCPNEEASHTYCPKCEKDAWTELEEFDERISALRENDSER